MKASVKRSLGWGGLLAALAVLGGVYIAQEAELAALRVELAGGETATGHGTGTQGANSRSATRKRADEAAGGAEATGADEAMGPMRAAAIAQFLRGHEIGEHPRYAPFKDQMALRRQQTDNGEFFARLDLPRTELDQLRALLAQWDVEPKIREFLGQERYQMYQDYRWTRELRDKVKAIQPDLAEAGVELISSKQVQALERMHRAVYEEELNPQHAQMLAAGGQRRLDQEFMARAATVLAPEQARVLGEYMELEWAFNEALSAQQKAP